MTDEIKELPSELPVVAFRVIDGVAWVRSRDYQRAVDLIIELKDLVDRLRGRDRRKSEDYSHYVAEWEVKDRSVRRSALLDAAECLKRHGRRDASKIVHAMTEEESR